MANSAADHLAALMGNRPATRLFRATVTAYREDGRVNVRAAGSLATGVLCLDSYTGRKAGDVVQIADIDGVWVVLGRYGADSAFTAPTGVPSATRQYRTDTYAQYNMDDVSGFNQVGASGRNRDTVPMALAWGFYTGSANALTAASTGKASLFVTLARAGIPHGQPSSVSLELLPHAFDALPTVLTAIAGTYTQVLVPLEIGEIRTVALPADWVTAIKAGTIKGYFLQDAVPNTVGNLGYTLLSATSGRYRAV